jgi:hypothetical protein
METRRPGNSDVSRYQYDADQRRPIVTTQIRILRDGGEIELRPGANRRTRAVVSQDQTVARLRWEIPPAALAYLDIDGRCYELVGTRKETGQRGIEARWAGEAVARLEIGRLGKAKQVRTRSGRTYEFRRTGEGTVLERVEHTDPVMMIRRWTGRGPRRYHLHSGVSSEEELGAILGVMLVYMVWNDRSQTIGALIAG